MAFTSSFRAPLTAKIDRCRQKDIGNRGDFMVSPQVLTPGPSAAVFSGPVVVIRWAAELIKPGLRALKPTVVIVSHNRRGLCDAGGFGYRSTFASAVFG